MSSTELATPEGELPTKEQRTPQIADGFGTSDSPQGMLFSPHSYTGLKDDPTIPTEQRMGAINKTLRLMGMDELQQQADARIQKNKEIDAYNSSHERFVAKKPYRKNLPNYGDTKTRYEKNVALANAANNLDIPTHMYEQGKGVTTKPTEWNAGWANARGGDEIVVGVRQRKTDVVEEISTHEPSDKPIPNKNFWSQYRKKVQHPGDIHSLVGEKDVHWTNDEGHTIQGKPFDHIESVNGGFGVSEIEAMDWLKDNNYRPNVYPTKGESGKKHAVGKKIEIESGYLPENFGFGYTYQTWHSRYEPDTTKPPKITYKHSTNISGYEANANTLAHELGHTTEPYGDENQRDIFSKGRRGIDIAIYDPVSEGYADSLSDRAHHYSGQFEKHLTNPQLRAKDISTTGYSSTFGRWNAEERALYSAVRFHVAAHPERIEGMKNRKELGDTLFNRSHSYNNIEIPTTKLMLGHMYEHMPHVRPVLNELGFGKTAKTAHETYMSRVADPSAMRGKGSMKGMKRDVYEQPELPGL